MITSPLAARDEPRRLRLDRAGLSLAVLAAWMLVFSPLGYRLGLLPLDIALLYLLPGAMLVATIALLLSVVALRRGSAGAGVAWPGQAVLAIALSLACAAVPALQIAMANASPMIHDVTTDTDDVPVFVALAAQRRAAANGIDYEGARVARLQLDAYPAVHTLYSPLKNDELFALAQRLAIAAGWQVAAAVPSQGRIEATATTLLYGFKDDIVIRVRPDGSGSRIDVRSMSRIGEGDLGANATRVQAFLERLRAAGA